jgi:hypothetical protein
MGRGKAASAVVAVAGAAGFLWWRRRARRREHVDLYFADGSMISFRSGSIEAARLAPLARGVLDAAAPAKPLG